VTIYIARAGHPVKKTTLYGTDTLEVQASGIASRNILSGGTAYVSSGGVASATTVDDFGNQYVLSGGNAFGTVINNGGNEIVSSDGITSNATVHSGGVELVSGTADGTRIDGGIEILSSGGFASNTIINSGGVEEVGFTDISSATTVNSGGMMVVDAGFAFKTTVQNHAVAIVGNIGNADGVTVDSGGYLIVLPSGVVSGVKGGGTVISSGVVLVQPGATVTVEPDTLRQLDVENSTLYLLTGGTISNTRVETGGVVNVFARDVASGTHISSGGVQNISGGSAYGTVIGNGGVEQVGPAQNPYTTGTTSGDIVKSGGIEILAGGSAFGIKIEKGCQEQLSFDSIDSGAAIFGTQIVSNFATVSGGIIYSGGTQMILGGGFVSGTTISKGGIQIDGGFASSTVILTGGTEFVSSGGTASTTSIQGGKLEVMSGGNATGDILFIGTGSELLIESKTMPTAEIEDFKSGDSIVLAAVPYSAGDTATVSKPGVVTVSAGGKAYNLNISGAKVGETDFTFGPGSILTKSDAPQMTFLRPPANASAGLAGGWNAAAPNAGLTASEFAPKILGGIQSVVSASHFGGLHAQEAQPIPMVIPVSITQPF